MKRKFFTACLMIVIMIFVFALCVSASTVYKDVEGNTLFTFEADDNKVITSYEGQFPKTDANGNALTWYVTATATENGNTVKTVASVLTTDEEHFTISNGTYSYKGGAVTQLNVVSVNFPNDAGITKLNLANGGYRLGNMYSYTPDGSEILFVYLPNTLTTLPDRIGQASKILFCDIPSNIPVTYFSHVMFHNSKSLRTINIPSSVTEIGGKGANDGSAFYMCESLESVTFGENSQLAKIGKYAFHKAGLKSITIPDTVTVIGEHAFSYTKLENSPFTEKSQLAEIGGRAFSDIPTLKTFIVPSSITKATILGSNDYGPLADSTVELVTFGNYQKVTSLPASFFGRAKIGKIILPEGPTHIPARYFVTATVNEVAFSNTIETAGERVFEGATVEKIKFGANFKHFANSVNDHFSFTNVIKGIKEFYIPATFYAQKPSTVYRVSYAFNCGSSSNIKFFYTGTLEQLTVALDNFKNGTTNSGDNNWKFTGATQISYTDYKADPESYNDKNYIIYDYNICDAFYEGKHQNQATINYTDFMVNGTKTTLCLNCKKSETVVTNPLFTTKGFSIPEDMGDGIAIAFNIDNAAISEYKQITGKSLEYGVFASLYEKLGTNEAINSDGTTPNGVVKASVSNDNYVAVEFKLTGFTTDEYKMLKLVMGAYVIESDSEGKKVHYLQAKEPTEGKYYYITYNTLANAPQI